MKLLVKKVDGTESLVDFVATVDGDGSNIIVKEKDKLYEVDAFCIIGFRLGRFSIGVSTESVDELSVCCPECGKITPREYD